MFANGLRNSLMRLMVCPRTSVDQYADASVTHFVSLIDPGETEVINAPKSAREKIQLIFSDLDDVEVTLPKFSKYPPPDAEHISSLVQFGQGLATLPDWGLLLHCEAGISRSTAAAITILTAAGYRPQTAFGLVRRVCPEMLPNRRMLRLTDEMLETGGWLNHMAEIHRRKAFQRAGYEDPTNVLKREAEEERKALASRSLLRKILDALPSGWRSLVGSGARMKAIKEKNGGVLLKNP